MEFEHTSVLLNECIEWLNIRGDGIYVDGTLGGGGHSFEICKRLSDQGRLIGIDQDSEAIAAAGRRLESYGAKVTIVKRNYSGIREVLQELGIEKVNGILLDLGVSSHQLDDKDRGFSYREDAPLDMRMDLEGEYSAADVVNSESEETLYRIIRNYGEERFAGRIARNIVSARQEKRIETTGELVSIIKHSIPAKARQTGGHPAKRTFQAIRIHVNRELDVLENTLDSMIDLLEEGGRLCIITFHSLEDRIVKQNFKRHENPCTCPKDFPVCVCGKKPDGISLTRKPILPSEEEMERNSRSKSAKLRVFEKKTQ